MQKVKQRATHVFWRNKNGYILALKRLKYMFGLKSQISQASISKLTWGKLISNDDDKSLLRYYYTTSDCVAALKQLNCVYDLHSTDVLRQTIKRLPSKFHNRWAEHCFKIRHICPLNMTQRNREILVVMRNGLVRSHYDWFALFLTKTIIFHTMFNFLTFWLQQKTSFPICYRI